MAQYVILLFKVVKNLTKTSNVTILQLPKFVKALYLTGCQKL